MARRALSTRALNRALLERQMLLRRRRIAPLAAVERLVALQAQVPRDPYVALWSRLERLDPASLSSALERRDAVRMPLLRMTLHLVSAADALALRGTFQSVLERRISAQRAFREAFATVETDELLSVVENALQERPLGRGELAKVLAERWPERDAEMLAYALYRVPVVQVTPRGLWGRSGRAAFTTVRSWLGRDVAEPAPPDGLVLRYLAAFGPATPADMQTWSGLAALREVFERLRPRLRVVRDEDGRELFDVPRAPLPDPDRPAPARFLPEYDNVTLGHQDRGRIVPPEIRRWEEPGWAPVLVDGSVAGRWKLLTDGHTPTIHIEPSSRLSRSDATDVEAEAERLLAFLSDGIAGDVRLDRPR